MRRKIKRSHGFTLAELLVVVAVIAVLIAVSVPIFTSKLEKSREAVDISNVRSAYSLVKTAALTGDTSADGVSIDSDGNYSVTVPLVQKEADWQTKNLSIGEVDQTNTQQWISVPEEGGVCKVTCSADGLTKLYWNGDSKGGFVPAAVAENVAPNYQAAINAVLSTVYSDIVAEQLKNSGTHVAFVLIVNGQVKEVSSYRDEAEANRTDGKAKGQQRISNIDLASVNNRISQALEGTNCKLTQTGRIFYDWNGSIDSNIQDSKIGGQGARPSLKFRCSNPNETKEFVNSTGVWS